MTLSVAGVLANHVWQSTLFVVLVWLATLALRGNGARVRFWLWTAASVKFLVPLSMLVSLGERFEWRAAPAAVQPAVSFVMQEVLAPADMLVSVPAATAASPLVWPWIVIAVWCAGVMVTLVRWWRQWLPIRAALSRATAVQLEAQYGASDLVVMSSPGMPEPGVVGIRRPRLLLPEGLVERLAPEQVRALIAHERCHIRCHDNLTAAIHMAIETVFWFHPVVWWIERRLIEERERACDESVLVSGSRPQDYAEGILEVCRQSVGLRLACVAGVSGANLRARVEAIMRNEIGRPMTRARRLALAMVVGATVLGPVAGGALRAQSPIVVSRVGPAFEEASLKRHQGVDIKTKQMYFSGDADGRPGVGPDGRFHLVGATNVTARQLLWFAFGPEGRVNIGPDHPIDIENAAGWVDSDRFDLVATAASRATQPQLKAMLQSLLIERFKLKAHRGSKEIPIYALAVARQGSPGPGLTPSQIDCRSNSGEPSSCGLSGTMGRLMGRGVTMAGLVRALANHLGFPGSRVTVDRLLVDRTDLSGAFDFTLQWTPDAVAAVVPPSRAPAMLPSVRCRTRRIFWQPWNNSSVS